MEIAKNQGIPCDERLFTRDEAYTADELFLCGTAAEVTPIRELDDRAIGHGRPGPITKEIQQIFYKAIKGEDLRYDHWLDYV